MLKVLRLLPLLLILSDSMAAQEPGPRPETTTGLMSRTAGAFPGYTLFAPLRSTTTYLIDMEGEVVHQWPGTSTPGNAVQLLPNGNLIRAVKGPRNSTFRGGGEGGRLQELAWDGTVLWDFTFSTNDYLHHHDFEVLPNGNVLLIAWEKKSREEAVAAGRNPRYLQGDELWTDFVVEIQPIRPKGGKVVWEWHAWDHLIQDFDPAKKHYGRISAHPEKINLNGDRSGQGKGPGFSPGQVSELAELGYIGDEEEEEEPPAPSPRSGPPGGMRGKMSADWMHSNSIAYNPKLDQIALSVRHFNELWIIDHSTTTEEAASSRGGRYGRGGDLLYRWGNPQAYGAGGTKDQKLFRQHDVRWIPEGSPGAGNLLCFNNGDPDIGRNWSSVEEITPPLNADGSYRREKNQAFGPAKATWRWQAKSRKDFFSHFISGAQRLPNGNTLVCAGADSRLFEVSGSGEVVWDYRSPFGSERSRPNRKGGPPRGRMGGPGGRGPGGIFRALRYPVDYSGLSALKADSKAEPEGQQPVDGLD
ncbi:MAG: hypothetical protein DWQ01_00910 [Planctomycetota bacterium]|nr:MAG: hypothetical protein DWQ01_00910 [Planctomycetota bacterium]